MKKTFICPFCYEKRNIFQKCKKGEYAWFYFCSSCRAKGFLNLQSAAPVLERIEDVLMQVGINREGIITQPDLDKSLAKTPGTVLVKDKLLCPFCLSRNNKIALCKSRSKSKSKKVLERPVFFKCDDCQSTIFLIGLSTSVPALVKIEQVLVQQGGIDVIDNARKEVTI